MITNKILYTYYEPISKIEQSRSYSQKDLINICQKSWEKYGWTLKILSEKDASSNSYYEEYKAIISTLPSVNFEHYDYHCFMRWLAMAEIGGGMMIDYDVMNCGQEDTDFIKNNKLTVYQGHVPCVVTGSAENYFETSVAFSTLKNNNNCIGQINNAKHTSDMYMLASGKIEYTSLKYVVDYPNTGKLVHCPQNICHYANLDKLQIMKILLN